MNLFPCLALTFLVALAQGMTQPKRISLYHLGLKNVMADQTESILAALKLNQDHEIQMIEATTAHAYNMNSKDASWRTEEIYTVRFNVFDTEEGLVIRENCIVGFRKTNVDTAFNLYGPPGSKVSCQKSN